MKSIIVQVCKKIIVQLISARKGPQTYSYIKDIIEALLHDDFEEGS